MLTQQSIYRFQTVSICFADDDDDDADDDDDDFELYSTYFHIIFHMFVSNLYFIQLQPKL